MKGPLQANSLTRDSHSSPAAQGPYSPASGPTAALGKPGCLTALT